MKDLYYVCLNFAMDAEDETGRIDEYEINA